MPKPLLTTDTSRAVKQKSVDSRTKAKKLRTPPKYPPCPDNLNRLILATNLTIDWREADDEGDVTKRRRAVETAAKIYYPNHDPKNLQLIARNEKFPTTEKLRHRLIFRMQDAFGVVQNLINIRRDFETLWGEHLKPDELKRVAQWDMRRPMLQIPQEYETEPYEPPQASLLIYQEIKRITEMEGVTDDRFKQCVICYRFFWAKKPSTEYCRWRGDKCYSTLDKRRQRQKRRSNNE